MPPSTPSNSSPPVPDEQSWRVDRIPNWGKQKLEEVEYSDRLASEFQRRYADRWKPVVLRGACRHWPAFEKWQQNDYLLSKWGAPKVDIFTAPNPQGRHPDTSSVRKRAKGTGHLSDLIASTGRNQSVRALPLGYGSEFDSMIDDLRDDWLFGGTRPPLLYPKRRVFLHRGGIALWHQHPVDDHLTFQLRGAKEFVLLAPNQTGRIHDVNRNELYSFSVDTKKYPAWSEIRPICARLEPGDAIYIPPNWWHTVVPVDQELGITLASVWGSSRRAVLTQGLRNMFYKGNRKNLPYLPLAFAYGLTGWRRTLTAAPARRESYVSKNGSL